MDKQSRCSNSVKSDTNIESDSLQDAADDSILDFKSPKAKKVKSTLMANFIRPNTRQKKKLELRSKSHGSKVEERKQSKKDLTGIQQSTIESSFFKPKDAAKEESKSDTAKAATVCPLCFKICKDSESQTLHIKSCAIKYNMSTKQLLDVMELQKRQQEERKSFGLLTGPVLPDRKKPAPRKSAEYVESDLQLGLALSKSLLEMEDMHDLSSLQMYNDVADFNDYSNREPRVESQLEMFGFAASNKVTASSKTRKRKLNQITVLQTRTEEERNRLLAERIAEILMANDAVTQYLQSENQYEEIGRQKRNIRRLFLKQHLCTEEGLWMATTFLAEEHKYFYVKDLPEYISSTLHAVKDNQLRINCDPDDSSAIPRCSEDSLEKTTETFGEQKRFYDMTLNNTSEWNVYKNDDCSDKRLARTIINDWLRILNDSSASDIIIYVKDEKHIWAHKLVFYVRCSNILLDVEPNQNSNFATIKESVSWSSIEYNVALAFLEFIYCGEINQYQKVLDGEEKLSSLRTMARMYKVQELFDYLHQYTSRIKQAEPKQNRENMNCDQISTKSPVIEKVSIHREKNDVEMEVTAADNVENNEGVSLKSNTMLSETDLKILKTPEQKRMISGEAKQFDKINSSEEISQKCSSILLEISSYQQSSMSPDMFDETDEILSACIEKCDTVAVSEERRVSMPAVVISKDDDNAPTSPESVKSSDEYSSGSTEKLDEFPREESIRNTPHSSYMNEQKRGSCSMKKQRSNLSLFIEKFRKENARSDTDTESDTTMILDMPRRLNRNPFNLKPGNDSTICSNPASPSNKLESSPRKNGLDALEYNASDADTEKCATNSPRSLKSNNDLEHITSDDECLAQLSLDISLATQRYTEEVGRSNSENVQSSHEMSNTSSMLDLINDSIDLTQGDSDEGEMSMYSKYKKTHRNNSIELYRSLLRKRNIENQTANMKVYEKEISVHVPEEDMNCGTDEIDVAVLSDSEANEINHSIQSRNKDLQQSREEEQSARKSKCSSFNNSRENDSIKISKSNSPEQILNNITCNDVSALKFHKNRSFCKTPGSTIRSSRAHSDSEMENQNRRNSISPVGLEFCPLNSPVLITSSPETDVNELHTHVHNNSNQRISGPLDDMENIFENEIYLANVRRDDDVISEPPSPLTTFRSEDLIAHTSINNLLNKKTLNDGRSGYSPEKGNVSASDRRSIRKFQRKSASFGHSIINTRDSNLPRRTQCNCNVKSSLGSLAEADHVGSTTPPPDYQSMDTPKLHKELKKYGLKLQKRKRAVKLLTHIYNELHPVMPISSCNVITEHDADEPPQKRWSQDLDSPLASQDCSQGYCVENELPSENINAEERHVDESNPSTASENSNNIKERFLNFVKLNRELYNKILSYEPLCLEALHSLIKSNGIKCNKNTLIDILDEQCITFYTQDTNRRERKRS